MREHLNTLVWLDRPWRELLRMAWPIAVSMLSYSLMTIVDTWFVSDLGASALAGVGLAGITCFTLICFFMGLMQGVKVLVAQAIGANRGDEVGAYLSAGIGLALICGSATVVLGHLIAPWLHLLAATEATGDLASLYLRIRILSVPLLLVFFALRETAYGQSDARTPMFASVTGNVVNGVLDYVFIWVLNWGVAGAAWASVVGNCVEAALLFAAKFHLIRKMKRIRMRYVVAVLRMGIPTGSQFLLEVGAFSVLTAMISAMSEVQMAAHQVVLHVLHVAFLPANAVAEAGSVLAGQAVGANRDDLVPGVARRTLIMAGAYAVLCTLGSAVGAPFVLSAFTDDPVLLAVAVNLMHLAAVFLIMDAASSVARNILRGTGDVRYAAILCITCAWLITPPLAWLLGYRLGMQAQGGWLGLCLEIFVAALLLWWRLLRGGWKRAAQRSRIDMKANLPPSESAPGELDWSTPHQTQTTAKSEAA